MMGLNGEQVRYRYCIYMPSGPLPAVGVQGQYLHTKDRTRFTSSIRHSMSW
jgi:hypothetical protein